MYKKVLFALDLEGVNYVVGKPYEGLARESEGWYTAREQAVKEINAGAEALFGAGVEKIALWDNHGGGKNLDYSLIDPRVEIIDADPWLPRMYFAENQFDSICYFGYHTMEGTLGGVLAHTMNSKANQFFKLNGKYIGEVDMDAYISAHYNMASCFFCGGDITCKQAERTIPGIITVVTKKELSRNSAEFRDNNELLADIKTSIVKAINTEFTPKKLEFPAIEEKSFKRTEDAAEYLKTLKEQGLNSDYIDDEIMGKDAHTVATEINSIFDLIKCI